MTTDEKDYLEAENKNQKAIRAELWLSPLLIVSPFVVSLLLLWIWLSKGYMTGSSLYNGELFIAMIIVVGNILFDIPFIKSLRTHKRR